MIVEVPIPNQGLTITEATIVRWHKRIGESVNAGETLFEIETDKAVQEIESPATGKLLAIQAQEGQVVPLGTPVAQIGTEEADAVGEAVERTGRSSVSGSS